MLFLGIGLLISFVLVGLGIAMGFGIAALAEKIGDRL